MPGKVIIRERRPHDKIPRSMAKANVQEPSVSELFSREVYIHRAVGRGLARTFFREFEEKEKAAEGGNVEFRFVDAIYFFAVAAANGVVGNLAYDALARIVRRVRRSEQEVGGGVRFEVVISRKTYNRLRHQKHSGAKASRNCSEVERKLETEYKLMVTLKAGREKEP